jgi:hypothetical protein
VEPVSTKRLLTVTQFVVLPGAQMVALAKAPLTYVVPSTWLAVGPPLTEMGRTLEPLDEPELPVEVPVLELETLEPPHPETRNAVASKMRRKKLRTDGSWQFLTGSYRG